MLFSPSLLLTKSENRFIVYLYYNLLAMWKKNMSKHTSQEGIHERLERLTVRKFEIQRELIEIEQEIKKIRMMLISSR